MDIIPCAISGSHRLWKSGSIFPTPGISLLNKKYSVHLGVIVIKYLERIPREFIEKCSIEELQEEVKKRICKELTYIPDEVIYNTENKPYKVFICIMLFVSVFWTLLIKLFY